MDLRPFLSKPPAATAVASGDMAPVRAVPPRPRAAMAAGAGRSVDLRAMALTLWRGKWIIAVAMAAAMTAAALWGFVLATPVWRASAVVMLETRQESVTNLQGVMSGLTGEASVVNSEVEVLRSRALLGRVVDALRLQDDPEFNSALVPPGPVARLRAAAAARIADLTGRALSGPSGREDAEEAARARTRAINRLRQQMTVSVRPQSVVFEIAVDTTDPRKSARIANLVAERYILEQLEVKFEATEQATGWLTERVGVLRRDLEEKQAALKAFASETDLVSAEALEALNRQLKELRGRIVAAETAETATRERLAALRAAPGDWSTRATLAEDRILTRLARRLPGDAALTQALETRYAEVIARAEAAVERARAQRGMLAASEPQMVARIEAQSADLVVLEQLEREAEASGLIYEYFLGRLKETAIQQGIQQADSRILSEAVVPLAPASPRRYLLIVMAGLLGALGGAGGMLLRESLANTYRSAEELERGTGRAVLGQIPVIPAAKRMAVFTYLADRPTSAAAEAVRNLRTSLLLSESATPPQVIMSTSSLPGEGKTTQSIALAQNIAAMGRRVLLIEGDIRRRVFREYFRIGRRAGLLSVVARGKSLAEAVHSDPALGFDILIGENTRVNAADLFSSRRFAEMLARARADYDTVIIDTPPVLVVPDARVIGRQADAVIYAVHWDRTRRESVAEGLRLFETVGVPVTGLVLSQIDPRRQRRYGYAGQYEAYGSGYYQD